MPLTLPNPLSYQVQHDVAMSDKYGNQSANVSVPTKSSAYGDYKSFDDWYYNVYGVYPNSIGAKLSNSFYGDVDAMRASYNQWYNERSEREKRQADYEYTRLLNQTQYADLVKSLQGAGLNPYAILANGGISAGNMSYSSSNAIKAGSKENKDSGSNKALIAGLALIISAIVKAVV